MEKHNKIFLIVTLGILIMIIMIPSFIKVNKKHQKLLYNSVIEEINYAAKLCYNQDNCGTTITLQELYDLKYLDEMSNPLTKEIYDHNLTITIKGNTAIFNG